MSTEPPSNLDVLRGVFELRRQQLIIAFLNGQDANIDPALVFAYAERMYPFGINEYSDYNIRDPFEHVFLIPKEFITNVLEYCDKLWLAKTNPTFYELEEYFAPGRDQSKRIPLFNVLRYSFPKGMFDDIFFSKLGSSCPFEAHGISRPFDPKTELYV